MRKLLMMMMTIAFLSQAVVQAEKVTIVYEHEKANYGSLVNPFVVMPFDGVILDAWFVCDKIVFTGGATEFTHELHIGGQIIDGGSMTADSLPLNPGVVIPADLNTFDLIDKPTVVKGGLLEIVNEAELPNGQCAAMFTIVIEEV